MDISNRSAQPQNVGPQAPAPVPNGARRKPNRIDNGKLGRIGFVVAAVVVAIIIVAVIVALARPEKNSAEGKLVQSDKLQAVFLNTGQVYFGKITTLNNKYFVVSNIYYLQTASNGQTGTTQTSASNTSVSLVKLGCELHEPYDRMVINRDQVTFWENLQDNGQVAQAVKTFVKQNPSGQKCADQSSSSSTNDSTSTQPATNKSTTTP